LENVERENVYAYQEWFDGDCINALRV